jgi:AcrR family transcriptional regulator
MSAHPAIPSDSASAHDRMLSAAKQLFSEKGYEATTTSAIARRAGTSESQLIKHFGNKEGLLQAILEAGWRQIRSVLAQVDPALSTRDKFLMLPKVVLRGLDADPQLRDLMLFEGRRLRKNSEAVVLTEGFQELVCLVDDLLARMAAQCVLISGVDPQAVRSALIGALEGLLRDRLLSRKGSIGAEYSDDQIDRVFLLFFNAVCQATTEQGQRNL